MEHRKELPNSKANNEFGFRWLRDKPAVFLGFTPSYRRKFRLGIARRRSAGYTTIPHLWLPLTAWKTIKTTRHAGVLLCPSLGWVSLFAGIFNRKRSKVMKYIVIFVVSWFQSNMVSFFRSMCNLWECPWFIRHYPYAGINQISGF